MTSCGSHINQKIGKNLRDIRLSLFLTQSELGDIVGVSFQQMQKYEKGTNRLSADKIDILATTFDIPYARFFEGDIAFSQNDEDDRIATSSAFHTAAFLSDKPLKRKIEKIVEILLD